MIEITCFQNLSRNLMMHLPSLKPFLNRLGRVFRYLTRPVPVVFRLFSLLAHSSRRPCVRRSRCFTVTKLTYKIVSSLQGIRTRSRFLFVCEMKLYHTFGTQCEFLYASYQNSAFLSSENRFVIGIYTS
jgi:hypothetical protein